MKQAMINYIQNIKNDELYTPPEGIYPLLAYLPKDKIYWECTDFGGSNITKILRENGFKVVSTHIKEGYDFLTYIPDFEYDIIITNPPYSIKDKFLERAYSLGKSFCFLLPITALEGINRGNLFRKYGIELLVLDKRLNFMKDKKGNWFNTSWFCWNVLPKNLIFAQINKNNKGDKK